jgi:uncharacterized protein (TIGR00369 family)
VIESARERLVRWQDTEEAVRAVAGLSGLEAIQALIAGKIPAPPMALLMNIRVVEAEKGRVVFEGEPGEEHYNPIGLVHGGFALTLLDSALGCAIHTALEAGAGYATTDIQVRMVRAIRKDTGRVRCEGTVQHVGRTIGISHGTIVDSAGKLLATGTCACAIIRP